MLKIVDSPGEKCLRPVGDPPNGVVTYLLNADGIGIAVSAKFEPVGGQSMMAFDGRGDPFDSEMIDTDDAVAALAGAREGAILWAMATSSLHAIVGIAVQQADFARIRIAVDGVEELFTALADRFG